RRCGCALRPDDVAVAPRLRVADCGGRLLDTMAATARRRPRRRGCGGAGVAPPPLPLGWSWLHRSGLPQSARGASVSPRVGTRGVGTPSPGGLVSARVHNLEQPDVAPELVRGRLGALGGVPQVEEAIASLSVRDSRIVRVAFPIHYPFPPCRGKSFLFHVKLLDAKPALLPPVIGRELLEGAKSVATLDATTFIPTQLDELVAE